MTMDELIDELQAEMKANHIGDHEITLRDLVLIASTFQKVVERNSPIPIHVVIEGRPDGQKLNG